MLNEFYFLYSIMPNDKNIAIFVNSSAGKGKSLQLLSTVTDFLKRKQILHTVFVQDWPKIFSPFTEAWIIGGDGTLNYFLNYFSDINIPLVLFKGGTGNDFAWKLYGDISIDEQLRLVLNADEKSVDAATCNDKIFINGVGIGFDGEVLKSMNTVRLLGGHLGYLVVVLKKIFTFKEYFFSIKSNVFSSSDKYLLLMISNSSRTGGGFHVSPLAQINDGFLNLIVCEKLSVFKRLRYLPVIEKGKHLSLPFIKHFTATSFVINCERETPAQLDGEFISAKDFSIKILPKRYLFKY
ncbi:diacylglycerol/lipid kinase family protein [Ferruginibacter sp. SUN002]|uniref:diacylglycerol/lipid kinase family protein n=1 Tax=Ferruginibacter sp. SUN002 TaxID=2937789 RepID=UPI003D36CBEE